MKFSQIIKGTRARKAFPLPMPDGVEYEVALVPLSGSQEMQALADARKVATERGSAEPKAGDALYERALWACTLAAACIDPESPEAAPRPFFDGGVGQILDELDRDRIAYLFEAQQAWQDECAPRPGSMTGDEFLSNVLACARSEDGAELPFERWRPVLRRSFVRSLALQAVISLLPRSPSGPSSPDTTSSSESSSPTSAGEG